ncbi:aminodeoxychorismate/anthranilate synthase component II [Tardisphaera miroshnichenkoae]
MSDITLIIDNYDSFVFNLAQYVGELGSTPVVVRNDQISLRAIEGMNPDRIIISPGPGTPEKKQDVGIAADVIRVMGKRVPILGVCFGHQLIGYVYGARIRQAKRVTHGKQSVIRRLSSSPIYYGIPDEFPAMRYHSLVVDEVTSPLEVDARSKDDGEIMGIHHVQYRIYGTQFHPESVGTPVGRKIIRNFVDEARGFAETAERFSFRNREGSHGERARRKG